MCRRRVRVFGRVVPFAFVLVGFVWSGVNDCHDRNSRGSVGLFSPPDPFRAPRWYAEAVPSIPSESQPRRKKQLVYKTITVPGNFRTACDQFNSGQFFECHESLEEIWQQEQGDVRDLYKGLIQVAAAFVHISRCNFVGADRLCRTALSYLEKYRAEGAMGFDVDGISRDTADAHARVLALGRGHMDQFDLSRRPLYAFDAAALPAEAVRWQAWGFDKDGVSIPMEIAVVE